MVVAVAVAVAVAMAMAVAVTVAVTVAVAAANILSKLPYLGVGIVHSLHIAPKPPLDLTTRHRAHRWGWGP